MDFLEILANAIEMEPESQDITDYNHARDNAISAFAKIMKYQHKSVDLEVTFEYLLQHVPLKHDMTESKFVIDFITEIALNNPTLITNRDPQIITQLITSLQETCETCNTSPTTQDPSHKLHTTLSLLLPDPTVAD